MQDRLRGTRCLQVCERLHSGTAERRPLPGKLPPSQLRDDNGSAGHWSSGSTNLSGSRGSRVGSLLVTR